MTQLHSAFKNPAFPNPSVLSPALQAPAAQSPSRNRTLTVADAVSSDLEAVESGLTLFFAERCAAAADHGEVYHRLWLTARDAADGGKRLRPLLLITAFHGLGGPIAGVSGADAVRAATSFELLHTAFLLHDDLIDGDTVRRGRPNVAGEFSADALFRGADAPRARLWGESAALLAGDLLLHAATDQLARIEAPAALRGRLLDTLDRAVFVTAAGELADVGLATGMTTPSLASVLAMTEWKTAAYSVSGPLVAGALLAGASDGVLDTLAEYGRLVGVAFQLGDDLLGVYGREELTGKSALSDLREGKETSLIAHARGTSHWPRIAAAFGRPELAPAEAAELAAALEECGARDAVAELLSAHVDAAIAAIDIPDIPEALAAHLTETARGCIGRLT